MNLIAQAPGGTQVALDPEGIYRVLQRLESPCYVLSTADGYGVTSEPPAGEAEVHVAVGSLRPEQLGSETFRTRYGTRYAFLAGAMAGGVASEELVIALAQRGLLGSFGAAGLLPDRIERALRRFRAEIPGRPYVANLIHDPSAPAHENAVVELYLRYGVRCVEASAFMDLTPMIVRYRVAGLRQDPQGRVIADNRVIAKVSRPEVAAKFLQPAPEGITADLVEAGYIDAEQAALARCVPMADDVTVEADSGGHTDRRPLPAVLPAILRQRDEHEHRFGYAEPVGVGAAGGIGTPSAAAAAYAMGADYVVTGSVNQSCRESGTSDAVRRLLAEAGIADCVMAPAADMFELGVELQVLKKGTLFAMRAKQLYELYRTCDALEALPESERNRLERTVFQRSLEDVWGDVVDYFRQRDPGQVERAQNDPKRRMALVFRWYLGMASRWAAVGEAGREADYQIWCGPAMGSFNDWVAGTYLADPSNRRVSDVNAHLLRGAAFATRVHQLRLAGARIPAACSQYRPTAGSGA